MKSLARLLLFVLLASLIPVPVAVTQVNDDPFLRAPIDAGATGTVGNFDLEVIDTTPDATRVVLDFDAENAAPAPGNQFFMVRIAARYTGTASAGSAGRALQFRAVGASGTGYFSGAATCGRLPDHKFFMEQPAPGESEEFNICWEIRADDADSLVMLVTAIGIEDIPAGAEEAWFSLGNDFSVQQLVAPEVEVTEDSSRTNPVPVGETGRVGDFLLTIRDTVIEPVVIQVPGEATPSPEAVRYLTATIDAVYTGDRFGNLVIGYAFALEGESGEVYETDRTSCQDVSQGVMVMPELFRGGRSDFVLCWKVDLPDASSPVLSVRETSDDAGDPVWFALGD